MRQYGDQQILYPDADIAKAKEDDFFHIDGVNKYTGNNPENDSSLFQKEKFVRNLQINFGPQHPAAHGVLRSFEYFLTKVTLWTSLFILDISGSCVGQTTCK